MRLRQLFRHSPRPLILALFGILVPIVVMWMVFPTQAKGVEAAFDVLFGGRAPKGSHSPPEHIEWRDALQLILVAIGLPAAFFLWVFRDFHVNATLENQRKDVNLKEFQEIQMRAAGAMDEKLPEEARETLQIAALHQLKTFLRGDYGEGFRRPAWELLRSRMAASARICGSRAIVEWVDAWQMGDLPVAADRVAAAKAKVAEIQRAITAMNAGPVAASERAVVGEEHAGVFRRVFPLKNSCFDGVELPGHALLASRDLTQCSFVGATLSDAHLEGADLHGAHLECAHLWRSHFVAAQLTRAHLEGAKLWGARLDGANLSGAYLEGADFWLARLNGALLSNAHLEDADMLEAALNGAVLKDAYLEGARLTRARLEEADLEGAHLEGATLTGAILRGATLRGVHLQDAILKDARLEGADLKGALLERVDLKGAHLDRAVLEDVQLDGADLTEAQLEFANLRRANLKGAVLRRANFDGADLRDANLVGADLRRAHLEEADLRDANLGGADIGGAILWGAIISHATQLTEDWDSQTDAERDAARQIWLDRGAVLLRALQRPPNRPSNPASPRRNSSRRGPHKPDRSRAPRPTS